MSSNLGKRTIFDRLADGIQNNAKVIVVTWVVVIIFMAFFAVKSVDVISYDLASMASDGSEAMEGDEMIAEYFPSSDVNATESPILVLYYSDPEGMGRAQSFLESLRAEVEGNEKIGDIISMDPTSAEGPGIIMTIIPLNGMTSEEATDYTPDLRAIISKVADRTGYDGKEYLSGNPAISYDTEANSIEDISKIDPFTVLMILLLVGLFFRSFVTSAVPPMTIGFAFVVTMGLIYFLGSMITVYYVTNMIILVSMMGAGCDYCIFIIARYREELRMGLSHNDAVHQSIVWAGESIAISGASVMIGFGAMSVSSYSMFSTMGICLAMGILVALIAALTLIPAILQLIGDRIFWPTKIKEYRDGGKATKGWYAWCARFGQKYFYKSTRFSLKHSKAIVVAAILVTVPAVYVMNESEQSYDMTSAMLSGESGDGMGVITDYADQGLIMPNYTVIKYKDTIATVNATGGGIGTLYWSDYWKSAVSPTLGPMYERMSAVENIAYAEGAFVWQDFLDAIEKEGITETDEKIEYIKGHLLSKSAMTFGVLTDRLKESGFNLDYLFSTPGEMLKEDLEEAGIDFDWDGTIEEAKSKGIEDPEEILDYVEGKFGDKVADKFRAEVDKTFKERGLDAATIIDGPGRTITKELQKQGIDFDWEAEVAEVEKHESDLNIIVDKVLERLDSTVAMAFKNTMKSNIDAMIEKGATSDILVNGPYSTISSALNQTLPTVGIAKVAMTIDWKQCVDAARSISPSTDATVVYNAAIGYMLSEYASAFTTKLTDELASAGITPETAVRDASVHSSDITNRIYGYFPVPLTVVVPSWDSVVDPDAPDFNSEFSRAMGVYSVHLSLALDSVVSRVMNATGMTNDILVNGLGPQIDEGLSDAGVISWDSAVALAKSKGYTDPDAIVDFIIDYYADTVGDNAVSALRKSIDEMIARGASLDMIVNGLGPTIDAEMEKYGIGLKWNRTVLESRAKGLVKAEDIYNDVIETYAKAVSDNAVDKINSSLTIGDVSISGDVLVFGLGPIIDYVMNVTNSLVGGEFVKSKDGSGSAEFILVTTATDEAAMSPVSMVAIEEVCRIAEDYAVTNTSIVSNKWDAGNAVNTFDMYEKATGEFTYIEVLVVVLIALLLFVVMKSYLIPMRSVLTIVMSIIWTLAATHLIFVGLLGIDIIWLVPIFLFVLCLGLGMDYDILLTTRIKENVMAKGMSNDDAIYDAVAHTGSVITICGLIMGGAFGTLMISGIPMFKEFGFALCFAILVDALVVRTYIVPAVMHLLGDWNWKGPRYKKEQAVKTEQRSE